MKQIHGQIGGVVQTLNEKIAKVLQKQEKEFLAAYRAHMYQVGSLRKRLMNGAGLWSIPLSRCAAGSKGAASFESPRK